MNILLKELIIIAVIMIGIPLIIAAVAKLIKKHYKKSMKQIARADFESAAVNKARDLKHDDAVINCDYCGAKIDTNLLKKCPQCGAIYDDDREWKDHLIDDVNDERYGYDKYLDRQRKDVDKKTADLKKYNQKVRLIIGALILIAAFVCIYKSL